MAEHADGTQAEHAFAEHEHKELIPGLNRIHTVAVAAGGLLAADFSIALLDILDWTENILTPHAAWEDSLLYPVIERRACTPWATRLLGYEHLQIRQLARALEADHDALRHEPSREQRTEMIGHLFALEALIRSHLEREERFLLPLLEEEEHQPVATPA